MDDELVVEYGKQDVMIGSTSCEKTIVKRKQLVNFYQKYYVWDEYGFFRLLLCVKLREMV